MSKRGINIYRRKDGRWEGRAFISSGKYKSVYGRSYGVAKEKLENLKRELSCNIVDCRCFVKDVLLDWLETSKKRIKESSYQCYRNKLTLHILPFFRNLKYRELSPIFVEKFIADKLSSGLSEKYVSDMVIMLKTAAKWAERTYGYADKIRYVESPKPKRKEPRILDRSDHQKLLYYLNSDLDNNSLGILLTLFSGLRIGELCALQWKDIDFENGILHITKTMQRIQTSGLKSKTAVRITSPKTGNSVRDIPLPDFLSDKLKKFRSGDDFYILSGTEKAVEPRLLSYRFKNVLKKADLPSIKFHALRHTFATYCLHKNFDIKTLSEILGHSGADITLRTYVHSSMERKRECMERLELVI